VTELVVVERDGPVGRVILNRPERRNALNDLLVEALGQALVEVEAASWCRAVVLTGAGPAFCAGGDMTANAGVDATAAAARHRRFLEVAERLLRLPKPTVAAVNGAAVGAGLSLALLCDEVVVARDATLSLAFLPLGLPPDLLSAWSLQRRVGWTVAADLLHSGRLLPAQEAAELRLVHEVVDRDVLAAAGRRAAALAELSPVAYAAAKALMRQAFPDPAGSLELEALAVGAAVESEEFQNAVARFRRPPAPDPAAPA
jgi:enoyl-CoA hydratase/carnithine racemase